MLAIKTILHPTDFSEQSAYAFQMACSLARDHGAALIIVHVVELHVLIYANGVVVLPPDAYGPPKEELLARLHQLLPRDPKVRVEHRLTEGEAASEILRLADETKCELVVMGTHGRTGLGRFLMGSVAEQVVRKAACPVLTVKTPLAGAQPSGVPSSEKASSQKPATTEPNSRVEPATSEVLK